VAVRLLDTNIISFVMKGHSLAASYQPHLTGYTLAVSFMSVAELREGAILAGWGSRRLAKLEATLNQLLILHTDSVFCQKWAEVRAARRSQPIGVADAWIAATALAHGLELVTHNPVDFQGIAGLTVITEAP
jgi:tRNA(fMet)-specific endonuclease VapC